MQSKEERRAYQRLWYQRNKRKNGHSKETKKFDKAAYMREYHAKKKAEKQVKDSSQLQNGEIMSVINAYKVLYEKTNNGEIKSQLNKSFAAIVVEMA